MSSNHPSYSDPHDPTAEDRKKDHINLAFASQVGHELTDQRFYYEPMLSNNLLEQPISHDFLGTSMDAPIWVSSMTGGTERARMINENLAKACGTYGLGMGLGSCRSLLHSDDHLNDFQVRKWVGDQPLYANLGVAQLEELIQSNDLDKVNSLVDKLDAHGLIVHVNPLQELMQPEGDKYSMSPIEIIMRVRDVLHSKLIVKEVGQGYGPKSIKALVDQGVDAIDFAAHGGTNFAQIELARASDAHKAYHQPSAMLGHTADQMVRFFNQIEDKKGVEVIISGGVKTYLDGYYFTQCIDAPAIYGQASSFLKVAIQSYEATCEYVEAQIKGLQIAHAFLSINENYGE